jgi:hypothetical protein
MNDKVIGNRGIDESIFDHRDSVDRSYQHFIFLSPFFVFDCLPPTSWPEPCVNRIEAAENNPTLPILANIRSSAGTVVPLI